MVATAFGDFTEELRTSIPNHSLENYCDQNNDH